MSRRNQLKRIDRDTSLPAGEFVLPRVPVSWAGIAAPAPEKSEGKPLDYRAQSLAK